jgi:hypothetical protein
VKLPAKSPLVARLRARLPSARATPQCPPRRLPGAVSAVPRGVRPAAPLPREALHGGAGGRGRVAGGRRAGPQPWAGAGVRQGCRNRPRRCGQRWRQAGPGCRPGCDLNAQRRGQRVSCLSSRLERPRSCCFDRHRRVQRGAHYLVADGGALGLNCAVAWRRKAVPQPGPPPLPPSDRSFLLLPTAPPTPFIYGPLPPLPSYRSLFPPR